MKSAIGNMTIEIRIGAQTIFKKLASTSFGFYSTEVDIYRDLANIVPLVQVPAREATLTISVTFVDRFDYKETIVKYFTITPYRYEISYSGISYYYCELPYYFKIFVRDIETKIPVTGKASVYVNNVLKEVNLNANGAALVEHISIDCKPLNIKLSYSKAKDVSFSVLSIPLMTPKLTVSVVTTRPLLFSPVTLYVNASRSFANAQIFYLVVANGIITHSGSVVLNPNKAEFCVHPSLLDSPEAHVIVFGFTNGNLISARTKIFFKRRLYNFVS